MHEHRHQGQAEQQQAQLQRLTENMARISNKLLVMSGKGGVGKSSVAVNLAVGLAARGLKVGLLDVDLHGPSVSGLLGLGQVRPEIVGGLIRPIDYSENIKVLSMGNLVARRDDALIWRGPMKIGVIRQLLADAQWGELDWLLIDSPPGTGDEPLTVAQDVAGVRALIVTTPQELALADVRKSLTFCRSLNMPVLGLVENMGAYVCPHCGQVSHPFGEGGGQRTAAAAGAPFLGSIPFDPRAVASGDAGRPFMLDQDGSPLYEAYAKIVATLIADAPAQAAADDQPAEQPQPSSQNSSPPGALKIALPIAGGSLCAHFGHCEEFLLISVNEGAIVDKQALTPPPHEPGVLPRWLAEQGADVIIAGGMGQRAQALFEENGIKVCIGAQPGRSPDELVAQYLEGCLELGENTCDH